MNVLRNEKGFIKVAFILAVLALCIYAGFQLGTPYYRYSVFKSDAKEIARVGLGNVKRTQGMLFDRVKELKLPIAEDDISVVVTDKRVLIKTSWSETVDLFGIYQKELNFSIDIGE
jgi:hypothetical protein